MPRLIEEIPLVSLELDSSSSTPMYKQLYDLFRESILSGKLATGQKLPGTRSLADELKISRNTVALAFNQLLIEGYIYGKTGSGSYVNDIPDNFPENNKQLPSLQQSKKNKKPSAVFGACNPAIFSGRSITNENIIPFQNGIPAVNEFPLKTWFKIINQVSQTFSPLQFGYGDAAGYLPLREAIASYLRQYRAVNCTAGQVLIVSGSQQGLDLIGRILLKPGSNVLLEDPGYFGARAAMMFANASIVPIPVDDEGIDIKYFSKKKIKPALIYTTPSHQFPTGITMSIARRLSLLKYAEKNKCMIVEDDYDGEFRYSGKPLPSLQGMDRNKSVLYLGTFSKVLFPGLRLGYLVLPDESMLEQFTYAKYMVDRQCPIFEQIVLAKFIEDGHFTRHIRKMRMLYKARQEILVNEVNKELRNIVHITPSPAGMHLIIYLPDGVNDVQISKECFAENVIVNSLSQNYLGSDKKSGLVLGYPAFTGSEIIKAVKEIKRVLLKHLG